jgi:hypothetical protein
MSSTYRGICLNHTPALEFPVDSVYQDLHQFIGMLQAGTDLATRGRTDTIEIKMHAGCDVVVGAYSYPLVELFCPPNLKHGHEKPEGMDADDLRRVLDDLDGPRGAQRRATLKWCAVSPCWTLLRIRALAPLLRGEGL